MLKQRIVTASILALVVIWVVLKLPATGFGLALLTIIVLGAWEWTRLVGLTTLRDRLLYVCGVLTLILVIWPLLNHTALMNGLLAVVRQTKFHRRTGSDGFVANAGDAVERLVQQSPQVSRVTQHGLQQL